LLAHTGTHIDAPLHFVATGCAIDEVSLATLIGPCTVVDLASQSMSTLIATDAEQLAGVARLLIKTGFGEHGVFDHHRELLNTDAADLLLQGGLLLVGTDRLSVDASEEASFTVHRSLLGSGCCIIEGLDLTNVAAGRYELCALPLPVVGAEASPARVLLRHLEGA
jgi:arylformamidase